ncbi:malate dehydrogenase [Carex littledalei]|uniref:Malate dehydrogenase n=1 Tax=Carex littledalei TaxID=544730 RepID=A0A833UYC3_9POAL|nr:malate dehydrogenase [Carex littledalei]
MKVRACMYDGGKLHIKVILGWGNFVTGVGASGASGQIGYALVPMVARGIMLGADQPVILHMLDIPPAAEALNGVKMKLVDAAFPLLKGVVATTDVVEACTGVSVAVMVGGFPRKEGMERKDVMSKNVSIYKAQASALEKYASPNCKVLVVANPANTNALILKEFAPSIPEKNITCLTRLDHNRALGQISERLNVQVSGVKNVIIWGNHSFTQYPDVTHATVGDKPVPELVKDDAWLILCLQLVVLVELKLVVLVFVLEAD